MNEESAPIPAAHRQVLTFRIANEWYALDVAQVRRVRRPLRLWPCPALPPALPGVFISQGQLIPAVDPRVILELPPPPRRNPGVCGDRLSRGVNGRDPGGLGR